MIAEAVALYGVEPSQFVAARNVLVRQLKADKRKDDAGVVAKLPRPRVGEYILNRVARDQVDVVQSFAAAVTAATTAQSNAIGTGDGAALRSTSTDLRAASAALVDAGLRHVQRDGLDGPERRDELISTVRALTNETGAALLVAGIVGSGVSAGEAEMFAGAPEPRVVPKRSPASRKPKSVASAPPAKRLPAEDPAPSRSATARASGSSAPAAKATTERTQPPPGPSAAELARQRRHEAQVDKAKAALSKAQREVAAVQRAVDAAARRLARAEADERDAAAALGALANGV